MGVWMLFLLNFQGFSANFGLWKIMLEAFLPRALYREFREVIRILMTFLWKINEIHHNSGVSAFCANYDGFSWNFPGNLIKIRLTSRNSLHNAPGKNPTTLQPEIIAKLTLKTLLCVIEMGFSMKIIPKQFFHVIL